METRWKKFDGTVKNILVMFTTGLVIGNERANLSLIIGGLATGFLVFILIVIIIWLLKRNEEREFQRKHKVELEI